MAKQKKKEKKEKKVKLNTPGGETGKNIYTLYEVVEMTDDNDKKVNVQQALSEDITADYVEKMVAKYQELVDEWTLVLSSITAIENT